MIPCSLARLNLLCGLCSYGPPEIGRRSGQEAYPEHGHSECNGCCCGRRLRHTRWHSAARRYYYGLFFVGISLLLPLPQCCCRESFLYICPCLRQSASSEEDEEEEDVEDDEEEEMDGKMAAGMSAAGTWQRQEDVLRRMNQQRNDILVRGSKRW